MSATPAPPASTADLEALADSLVACADELHTRLMRAIRGNAAGAPSTVPASIDQGLAQGAAQALFENEVALRQRANGLYLDAAALAAAGLDGQQRQLLDLTALAQEKLRKINRLKDMIDLSGELLALGAAVAAGQPEHLASPLEKIRRHLAALKNDAAAPPSRRDT
jgi:hypothetical protein